MDLHNHVRPKVMALQPMSLSQPPVPNISPCPQGVPKALMSLSPLTMATGKQTSTMVVWWSSITTSIPK